jgi:RNA polymerase sigma-70 factor (ECF subfamily)
LEGTENTLLGRLKGSGARADWDRFTDLYCPLVEHWARRLCPRQDDVPDLVQDVFVRVMEKLPSFTGGGDKSFLAWLRSITTNRAHDLGRRAAVRSRVEFAEVDEFATEDEGLRAAEQADERDLLIRRAIQVMQADFEPTTWRACWECVAVGRPAGEVATDLGVSVEVVYSACYRVIRRLRQELVGMLR